MRTTFLGLQRPFEAWLDGTWQPVKPYTARETLEFPAPLRQSQCLLVRHARGGDSAAIPFPVSSVITKFGVVPDFYNHATWTHGPLAASGGAAQPEHGRIFWPRSATK